MTADTSADCRQVALGTDDAYGIAHVSFLQLVNPVWDIIFYRASLLTLRHLAVQASLSLLYGLGHRIALVNLFCKLHGYVVSYFYSCECKITHFLINSQIFLS